MLKLSIREFNKNISGNLKKLPLELTKRGVVVAKIVSPVDVPPDGVPNVDQDEFNKVRKALPAKVAKIAGERSSVKEPPPSSAYPPPQNLDPYDPPKLRKKLCPKHSTFSCGCPEK